MRPVETQCIFILRRGSQTPEGEPSGQSLGWSRGWRQAGEGHTKAFSGASSGRATQGQGKGLGLAGGVGGRARSPSAGPPVAPGRGTDNQAEDGSASGWSACGGVHSVRRGVFPKMLTFLNKQKIKI